MLKNLYIKVIARITPSCAELARLSSESLERKLSMKERLLVLLHGTVCGWCKRYEGQLQKIHDTMQGKEEAVCDNSEVCMSTEGKDRLKALLKDK